MATRLSQIAWRTLQLNSSRPCRYIAGLAQSGDSTSDIWLLEEERKQAEEERKKQTVQVIYSRNERSLPGNGRQRLDRRSANMVKSETVKQIKNKPATLKQHLLVVDMSESKYLLHSNDHVDVQPALKAEVEYLRPDMIFMQNLLESKYELFVKLWMVQLGYTGVFHVSASGFGQATFYRQDLMSTLTLPIQSASASWQPVV